MITCESEVKKTKGDDVTVGQLALAVSQDNFDFLVPVRQVVSQTVLDVLTMEMQICSTLERIVEPILSEACHGRCFFFHEAVSQPRVSYSALVITPWTKAVTSHSDVPATKRQNTRYPWTD